ncbi:hypothetical protein RRG08_057107 [Elysia crispata]|uniref:G-protein coupled receptors family 1 profile domain-containing protein n=1 Tax=Elysia crispata TaxID=231223 RepID=A0AAE0YKH1_9GAST|nr:hypothetical protein RRG08_057107 [Elysia crispata]
MKLTTSSTWGLYDIASPGVSTAEYDNNNLTFIPNLNQTSFLGNNSILPSLDKNDTLVGRCPQPSEEEIRLIRALFTATKIQVYTIFSIALFFGLPGSVFALVTLSTIAVSPTKRYISFLAISDFAALILASSTIYRFAVDADSLTSFDMISISGSGLFQIFSHWILVLICEERFVSVRYPFQKSRLYTRRATFLSVGVAFIVSLVPFPLTYLCFFYDKSKSIELMVANSFLSSLICIIIPGVLIIIFTTLTACHVRHKKNMAPLSEQNSQRSVTMETQLTRMMFVTVICFAVFTFPVAFILLVFGAILKEGSIFFCHLGTIISLDICLTFAAIIFLNNASNFYVYFACAKGFRKQFALVICCNKTNTRR